MIPFELFFEKCQSPVSVLSKYKDDPDVFISFTNIIQPRAGKEGSAVKDTNRIGLNPLTSYDTPAGVYTYPLNAYWDNIKEYQIPFVKDMPYVHIVKPKRPEKCARASTYTQEDFDRDFEELKELFPQYHLDDLKNYTDSYVLRQQYPDHLNVIGNIAITDIYKTPHYDFFGA